MKDRTVAILFVIVALLAFMAGMAAVGGCRLERRPGAGCRGIPDGSPRCPR